MNADKSKGVAEKRGKNKDYLHLSPRTIKINSKKVGGTCGIGLFFLFLTIFGAAAIAVVLLKAAWKIWKKARLKFLAVIPLLLGGFCAFVALYFSAIILREGFYSF